MTNSNNINYFSNQNNIKINKEIIIPNGYRELLQDMTVEVLRLQPPDVLTFCINWLQNIKDKRVNNQQHEAPPSPKDEMSEDTSNIKKSKFTMDLKKKLKDESVDEPSHIINNCGLFANVDKSLIKDVFKSCQIKPIGAGEQIQLQSDNISEKIYIVQSGKIELFTESPHGKEKLCDLTTNDYFGDAEENLTCISKTDGKLIVINRKDIDNTVLIAIEERRKEFKEFIENFALFSNLSSYEKRMILDSMVLKEYMADEEIIKVNDVGKEMFLVYEGFVSVVQNEHEVASINDGGYFGELALLNDAPRTATVVAIIDSKLLSIGVDIFKKIIEQKCMEHMKTVMASYLEREKDDEEESSDLITPPLEQKNLPRKSVSAGKFNPEMFDDEDDDEENEEHNSHDFTKTDEQRERLRKCCKDILLFRCLDEEQLEVVIDSMFQILVNPGDVIITRGEDGDNFYVIDNGIYDIIIPVNGVDTVVSHYDNKGSFGELALMYNTPRSATVIAKTNGLLWAMTRDMFRKIVLKKAFQKRLLYDNLLAAVPFLKELSSFERNNVSDALRTKVYEEGTPIIKQGEEGLEMFFIEEGDASIYIEFDNGTPSKEVGQLTKGQYFGEMALINQKPRAATIIAKTKCKIAVLDRESFERLLGPCVELMKRNMLDYVAFTTS